jgi:hypothetical protein
MTDPALIAQLDQIQAAFGTWADMLVIAWRELTKRGVPTERAWDMAADWIGMAAQTSLEKWAHNE